MRPSCVRLTLRGMMVAIAIIAVAVAAEAGPRRAFYQQRAAFHAAAEQRWLQRAIDVESTGTPRDAGALSNCEWVDSPANRPQVGATLPEECRLLCPVEDGLRTGRRPALGIRRERSIVET